MLSGANGKRGASTKRLAAAEPRRIAQFDAKQNSKNFSSHHLEICAERQMSDDPVWLADNVMESPHGANAKRWAVEVVQR